MTQSPLLEVKDLCRTYFMDGVSVKALQHFNLAVHRGEFITIMGSSGSGKSTLMHILGCLDRPTSGTYKIEGEDVSNFSRDELAVIRNRKIGFVFQGFNLLSRTSALENVELPMIYAGVAPDIRHEKAMQALDSVGLKGREHHHSNQLSGGQQQRVAIARSLVNNPAVILADEPTGNLDSYSSVEVMGIFQDLNDKGISIVLITHEPDISHYGKRLVHLSDGMMIDDQLVPDRLIAAEEIKNMPKREVVEEQSK
ncbi:MAG: ABC transporter ATP-binding protein [Candidatus Rifleibacteriota bacterium]